MQGAEVAGPIRDLASADNLVRTESREAVGTVHLHCAPGYGEIRLNAVLDRFRSAYPRVVCDVELTDRFDLSTGEIDVAIRATADPLTICREATAFEPVGDGSGAGHLERHGHPATVDDIEGHAALVYRSPNGPLPWLFRRLTGEVSPVPRKPAVFTNHGMHLLRMACAGEGLTMLPRWGITKELADGHLVEVRGQGGDPKLPGPETSVYLLYDPRKARLGKVRALVDFLADELADEVH